MLHSAARSLSRRFEMRTRDASLTSAQWRLLVLLKRDGPMRQARLAEALEIEPISVSRMIDRMAAGGWVERMADPDDRRARLVGVTDKARASLSCMGEIADVVYAEALDGFSAAEVEALMVLVARMVTNLSAVRDPSPADDDRKKPERTEVPA